MEFLKEKLKEKEIKIINYDHAESKDCSYVIELKGRKDSTPEILNIISIPKGES